MIKIAVFASGSGSNFQAIAEAVQGGALKADLTVLICDRRDASVLERAARLGICAVCLEPRRFSDKQAYEQAVLEALHEHQAAFIVLAGYMRLIGPVLLEAYEGRIVNIHPSLLPAFPGKDAVGQALEAGVKITGLTVHFVDAGMDTGQIIAQEAVKVMPGDTRETLQRRIQQTEHRIYPAVLQELLQTITT